MTPPRWFVALVGGDLDHRAVPCGRCGRCCCPRHRRDRVGGKWFAPAEGGYHGCSPARVRPTVPPAAARRPAVTPPPAVPQSQYGLDLADPRVVWMPPADPVRHPHDLPDMFRVPMGTVARCSICGATFRLGTAPGGAGYTWTPVRLGG